MRNTVTLLLATTLLVAACSSGGGGASPTPVPSPAPPGAGGTAAGGLDGRTFLVTKAEGRVLVGGNEIRMTFKDGQLSARAGCNAMGGEYRVAGAKLTVGMLSMTEMACAEPLMAQETWFSTFLSPGVTYALDGNTLTLTGAGVVLTALDREVADPDQPLEGTLWMVTGLVNGGAVSSLPNGVVASLRFDGGQVAVESGCNKGGGAYTVDGEVITFASLALTKMGCDGDRAQVESAVTSVLQGRVGFVIEAGTLQLGGGTGPGLILSAEIG